MNSQDPTSGLTPEQKRALLADLLRKRKASNALDQIPTAARDLPLPLSVLQERLWFVDQLQAGAIDNLFFGMRLRGPLDLAALSAAVSGIVARHEALRTVYRLQQGRVVQVICLPQPVCLEPMPVEASPGPLAEAALARLAEEAAAEKIDLACGPVCRFALHRLGPEDHALFFTVHHIAFDDHSLGTVMRELSALYQAHQDGLPSPLPPPSLQYCDFAAWHRRSLDEGRFEAARKYWAARTQGAPKTLELPTDHLPEGTADFAAEMIPFTIPVALARRLEQLCKSEGTTSFMGLLAVYRLLLQRYSRQQDVVIGTPFSGRFRPELDGVVGYFVNLLPLRIAPTGTGTFRDLLRSSRQAVLEALEHQQIHAETLGAQQIRATFNYNKEQGAPPLGAAQVTPFSTPLRRTVVDVGMLINEGPEDLAGILVSATQLFERATAERMAAHYVELLRSAVDAPDRKAAQLGLLLEDERRLIATSNATLAELGPEGCVHRLVEEQVARTPEACAVEFEGSRLTYRELDQRAGRLSARLRQLGVGPERVVALMLRPSLEQIVAVYAVLKAGGAYLPLDPDAPAERLDFVLTRAEVKVTLTQLDLLGALPVSAGEVVCLDQEGIWEGPEAASSPFVHPDNLAYVIFTSGSTGEPKGVQVTHRSVCNHNRGVSTRFGLGPSDRMLQFTPIYFDAAVEEIFPPLISGSTVVVRGELVPSEQFRQLIEAERLTVLSLPPAYLHEWVTALARRGSVLPDCLRLVILGGEKLLPETWQLWRQVGGDKIPWINVYGPTEATVTSAMCEISAAGTGLGAPALPIGGPIANVQIHLLDALLEPVPPGHPGELYIGGAGLARGYLGRPDLTAERFLPDPFCAREGARIYRTGDLARYLPDGRIEFLGRADHQVKLRGFRVELGEVESALRQLPGVEDAVAVVRGDGPGEKQLVGYVVGVDQPSPAEVRAALGAKLPHYMVPGVIVALDALPLTANGKVDRNALPRPGQSAGAQRPSRAADAAPATAEEALLLRLWSEILDLPDVDREHDFFALGGHSLMVLRVLDRIREEVGVELPIMTFYENATVAQLAQVLVSARGKEAAALQVVRPEGDLPALFCVHALYGNTDVYLRMFERLDRRHPVYVLRAPELVGEVEWPSVEERASLYLRELREVRPVGPYLLVGYSTGGTIAYEMAQQLRAAGESVPLVALFDTRVDWREDFGQITAHSPGRTLAGDLLAIAADFGYEMEAFGALALEGRLRFLLEAEQKVGRLPDSHQVEDVRRMVRLFRVMLDSLERYRPRPTDGPVDLFASEETFALPDPSLGWKGVCQDGLRIHPVCGTQSNMLQPPQVEGLAARLSERLLEVSGG